MRVYICVCMSIYACACVYAYVSTHSCRPPIIHIVYSYAIDKYTL